VGLEGAEIADIRFVRVLLAAQSPVFRSMFFDEAPTDGPNQFVRVPYAIPVVRQMLRYVSTAQLDCDVTSVVELHQLAVSYQINLLSQVTLEFIEAQLCKVAAADILIHARSHKLIDLEDRCKFYLQVEEVRQESLVDVAIVNATTGDDVARFSLERSTTLSGVKRRLRDQLGAQAALRLFQDDSALPDSAFLYWLQKPVLLRLLCLDFDAAATAALLGAVKAHDVERTRWALEAGADPNYEEVVGSPDEPDYMKISLLSMAGGPDSMGIMRLLVEGGANLDYRDDTGSSTLFRAASCGHLSVVQILVQACADLELADDEGWTPLLSAAWNGNFEVVRFLMKEGAKKDAVAKCGRSVLRAACSEAEEFGPRVGIVKFLLEERADVNVDPGGWTALHAAASARCENLEVVKLLLEARADMNLAGADGRTPLDVALQELSTSEVSCTSKVVDYLREVGARQSTPQPGKDED